jgi:hypothetical protein
MNNGDDNTPAPWIISHLRNWLRGARPGNDLDAWERAIVRFISEQPEEQDGNTDWRTVLRRAREAGYTCHCSTECDASCLEHGDTA